MTNETQQPQTIVFEDKEYKLADLTQDQLLLVNHCFDIENKVAAAKFQLQQLQVTQNTFTQMLRDALKPKETSEVEDVAVSKT